MDLYAINQAAGNNNTDRLNQPRLTIELNCCSEIYNIAGSASLYNNGRFFAA